MWRYCAAAVIGTALHGCGDQPEETGSDRNEPEIAKAEAFIDAFYSFDARVLSAVMDRAESSRPAILFYQGWAQGGNYRIVNRKPCTPAGTSSIACPVTVDDDLINALGLPFDVTDTFRLTFSGGEIIAVETSSDDPPQYHEAKKWVRDHRPELIEVPCQGYFAGGRTPGACVKAMVQGYREFATGAERIANGHESAAAVHPAPPDEARRVLNDFLGAFENLDLEGLTRLLAEDATVFFPAPEPPQRFDGRSAIRKHFRQVFAAIRQSSAASSAPYHHLEPENLSWQVLSPQTVVATFQLQNSERIARRTVVLDKSRGTWLIMHLHASNVPSTVPLAK